MAKSRKPLTNAILSNSEMQEAIVKIVRRINELKQLDIQSIKVDDPQISVLENKVDAFLSDTFGNQTYEYSRYKSITTFYNGSINLFHGVPLEKYRSEIYKGVNEAIAILESIKADFQEKLQDSTITPNAKAFKAYEGLELHHKISSAVGQLYHNEHYSNAVEDAMKALNDIVRTNSGVEDTDGVSLMQRVFSPNNPILKFNDLRDETDKSEQRGFMDLFSGAVAGLRNPRAHKIIKDDPERTLEFIAFISLLAKMADEAKK